MKIHSAWVSALLGLGLLLVFVGERLVGAGTARGALSALGAFLCIAAFAARLMRAKGAGERRPVEMLLAALHAAGLAGLVVYFLQSDVLVRMGGARIGENSSGLAASLEVLTAILIAVSVLPTVLAEMAYASVGRAPRIEVRRIRDAVYSGLGLTAAITLAFAVAYVAASTDPTWDFSYFRTAKPGEGTRKLIRGLEAPLEVSLFFPPGNDVFLEVREYLRSLESEGTRLHVNEYDAAVDLAKAREVSVSSNGAVVLQSGKRKETLLLPLELDRARGDLRKLDQTLQDRIFALTRPRRVIYVTVGHGERSTMPAPSGEARAGISNLRKLLEALNQDVKVLGASEGLASEVPADAAAVLVVGPTQSLLPEEQAALSRYFMGGGRVLVALDPDSSADLGPLLASFGLALQKTTLANDRIYVQRNHTLSDRTLIATATFSSHPSVTTLSQAGGRLPTVFFGAGYLEESKAKPTQLMVDFPVRAHPSTFNDINGNFQQDPPGEARKGWPIVGAASRKTLGKPGEKPLDSRALVFADSDWMSDGVLESLGNTYLGADSAKWLIGEEAIAGAANKETDVRIEHSRGEDTAYFYLTIFAVPTLVLGGGILGTRRRRRQRRTP